MLRQSSWRERFPDFSYLSPTVTTMLDKRAVLSDRGACMECGACARNCEHGAISVRAGVGCAAALLANVGGSPEAACCGPESVCTTTGEMSP